MFETGGIIVSESEVKILLTKLTPEQRREFIDYLKKETLNNQVHSDVYPPAVVVTN